MKHNKGFIEVVLPLVFGVALVCLLGWMLSKGGEEERLKEHKRLTTYVDSKFCISECVTDRLASLFKSDGQFLGGSSTASLPMTQDKTLEIINAQCVEFVKSSKCVKKRYGNRYQLLDGTE